MNISRLIKEIRLARKWPLRQLAAEIGIEFTALHRLESGKPLDQANLSKVIRWLFS
jgi:transcriptional regulator with XRE-family HTH domain